jgi:hypothetical protein
MNRSLSVLALLALTGCPAPVASPTTCEEPAGPGVVHSGVITSDETWRAEDGPHSVPSALQVRATLTLDPCVVVHVGAGVDIDVGDSTTAGRIVANGTAERPIRFESASAGTFFGTIFVSNGSLDFEHVELEHGGASRGAVVEVVGPDDGSVEESLRAVDTRIVSPSASGVRLTRGAGFTDDSRGLTITGAGADPSAEPTFTSYPIDIDPPGLFTIPEGTYTGNVRDVILVRTPNPRVSVDETFRNVGVPYLIDDTFLMYDEGGADLTLTVEPGTTLRFDPSTSGGVGMVLGNAASGSEVDLVALGTSAEPIVFTSTAASAGAWAGILMAHASPTGSAISNVVVEYAGGETNTRGFGCGTPENVGGLLIVDWMPTAPFVTSSTFRHTLGAGIVSGWRLMPGESPTDLRADNVFEDIQDYADEGHCEVAEWHPDAPDCRVPQADGITCVGQ